MRNGSGIVGLLDMPDSPGARGMIATGLAAGIAAVRPAPGVRAGISTGIHAGTHGPLG